MLVKLVLMISQLLQLNLILKQKHQNNPDMVMSQLMQVKLLLKQKQQKELMQLPYKIYAE